jgi:hypothetical protein
MLKLLSALQTKESWKGSARKPKRGNAMRHIGRFTPTTAITGIVIGYWASMNVVNVVKH